MGLQSTLRRVRQQMRGAGVSKADVAALGKRGLAVEMQAESRKVKIRPVKR